MVSLKRLNQFVEFYIATRITNPSEQGDLKRHFRVANKNICSMMSIKIKMHKTKLYILSILLVLACDVKHKNAEISKKETFSFFEKTYEHNPVDGIKIITIKCFYADLTFKIENNQLFSSYFRNIDNTHSIYKQYIKDADYSYCLKDEVVDSLLTETKYINDVKVFESQFVKETKEQIKIDCYYLDGTLMTQGECYNGGLCYLNEYDNNGKIISTNQFFIMYVREIDNNNFMITSNWFKMNPVFDTIKYSYALYRVSNNNKKTNLMENNFEEIDLLQSSISIPFNFEAKGKYLFRSAFSIIQNYEEMLILKEVSFEFDNNGKLINHKMFIRPIKKKFEHPFSTVIAWEGNPYNKIVKRDSIELIFNFPREDDLLSSE